MAYNDYFSKKLEKVRQPGIEPGSIAWKATMLTFTPPTLVKEGAFFSYLTSLFLFVINCFPWQPK